MCIRDRVYTVLRTAYSSALINGPFSILVGSKHGLLALNDMLKRCIRDRAKSAIFTAVR